MIFKLNKTINNIFIYTVITFLQKTISFFLIPILTRFLTPSEFGLVNQLIALGSFYILLFTLGFDEAAARSYFEFRKEPSNLKKSIGTIFSLTLILVGSLGLILWVFNSFFYTKFIGDIGKSHIILSIIIVFSSPFFLIYQKILRINENAFKYGYIVLIYSFTQIIFSIVFVIILKYNSLGYMFAYSFSSLLVGIISIYNLYKIARPSIEAKYLKDIFKYSFSVLPHSLSGWGYRSFTIIAIGYFLNSQQVGIFNAMLFLGTILFVFSVSFFNSYQPYIYKKLESLNDILIRKMLEISKMSTIVFTILSSILMVNSLELIQLIFDERYHEGFFVVPIYIFSVIMLFIGSLNAYILLYNKSQTKMLSFSTIIGALGNVMLCYFLIPYLGITGAALSIAFSNLLVSALKENYARKCFNKKIVISYIDVYILSIINLIMSLYFIEESINFYTKNIILFVEVVIILLYYGYKYKYTMKEFVSSFQIKEKEKHHNIN